MLGLLDQEQLGQLLLGSDFIQPLKCPSAAPAPAKPRSSRMPPPAHSHTAGSGIMFQAFDSVELNISIDIPEWQQPRSVMLNIRPRILDFGALWSAKYHHKRNWNLLPVTLSAFQTYHLSSPSSVSEINPSRLRHWIREGDIKTKVVGSIKMDVLKILRFLILSTNNLSTI